MTRISITVGNIRMAENADEVLAHGNNANTILDAYNSDPKGFYLINQNGQIVASVVSIIKATGGFVPFLNITTNAFAGTLTFLKITIDVKEGREISRGDAVSLAGNVVGVLAALTVLSTAPSVAAAALSASIVASAAGIIYSGPVQQLLQSTGQAIYSSIVRPIWNRYFEHSPSAHYPELWIAPNRSLASPEEIKKSHHGKVLAIKINGNTGEVTDVYMDIETGEISSTLSPPPEDYPPLGGSGFRLPSEIADRINFPNTPPIGRVTVGEIVSSHPVEDKKDSTEETSEEDSYDCCDTYHNGTSASDGYY